MQQLAHEIQFWDLDCVEIFRQGADLYDEGTNLSFDKNAESNAGLITSLRSDENDQALHEIAMDDFSKHRMTEPVRASTLDSSKVSLTGCAHILLHDACLYFSVWVMFVLSGTPCPQIWS